MLTASVIVLATALVFAAVGFWFYRKVQAMRTWPSAGGTILDSAVVRKVSTDSDGTESVGWGLALRYRYAVGGTAYTGTRIALAEMTHGSPKAAEQRLMKYPPGGAVQVKYDPSSPESAVLEESGAWLGWVFGGIGAALLIVAALLFAAS